MCWNVMSGDAVLLFVGVSVFGWGDGVECAVGDSVMGRGMSTRMCDTMTWRSNSTDE